MDKIIKQVLKKQPSAKLLSDENGFLYIDVNGINLSEQHLLPPTTDSLQAWKYADISLKMTQNFNRTHPMRVDGYSTFDKKNRIKKRGRRNNNPDYYMPDI